MEYLENNKNIDFLFYWINQIKESILTRIILQYTDDGNMILGFTILDYTFYENKSPFSKETIQFFFEIKKYIKCNLGCITREEPPPRNSIEFIDFCKSRFIP